MIIPRTRVTCIADVTYHRALAYLVTFLQTVSSLLKVSVIIDIFAVDALFIDRNAARHAVVKLDDLAVRGGQDRRSARCHYVDSIVNASAGSGRGERILQLFALNTGHGYYKLQASAGI